MRPPARERSRSAAFPFVVLPVVALLSRAAVAGPSVSGEFARLFSLSGPSTPGPAPRRQVVVNPGALDADGIEAPWPDGRIRRARRVSLVRRGTGDVSWTGRLADEPTGAGDVVLSAKDGRVAGAFFTAEGMYRLLPDGADGSVLVRDEGENVPLCDNAVIPPTIRSMPPSTAPPVAADPADAFHLLVVYTAAARSAAGGTAAIEATIQNAVDLADLAYTKSQVVPRLYLVHATEVGYAEVAGGMSEDLEWVTADPGVAALRDTYGADLVALVTRPAKRCGIAYLQVPPGADFAAWAFSVVQIDCLVGLTLAHEVGHNQGCAHNPENAGSGAYQWSFGHWVNGLFRTVMSYPSPCTSGCPRIPYFSNADVFWDGVPTGIADERENYRTINDTASYVANFRQSIGCGNRVLEPGEDCDDGNTRDGDCCSADCRIEGAGGECRPAAGPCDTPEYCDGIAGACPTDLKRTDVCRPAVGACDVADSCDGVHDDCPPDVTLCDDGELCTQDSCTVAGCVNDPIPRSGCNAGSSTAMLLLRDHPTEDAQDHLLFKWLGGQFGIADLGAPTTTSAYAVCVYAAGSTVARLNVPAAATCGGTECWSGRGSSVVFRDPQKPPEHDGVRTIVGRPGDAGRARLTVKAKGETLPDLVLGGGLNSPVTAQVVADGAMCWEATFATTDEKRNEGGRFKAVRRAP